MWKKKLRYNERIKEKGRGKIKQKKRYYFREFNLEQNKFIKKQI